MSNTAGAVASGIIISASLMAILMSLLAEGEISKRDHQIIVLKTQLEDAKESKDHADYKFKLCMENRQ